MKKIIFILGLFIIFSFFIGQANFVEAGKGIKARGSIPTLRMLEVEEPKILPISPFYFLKDWGRGMRQFLTFDPVKKAELELKYADEKLVEFSKVVDENCGENTDEAEVQRKGKHCTKDVLEKALNNYLKSQEKLAKRLESLSKNKNIEELLNKLGERVIIHQALFDEIINDVPALEIAIREGGKTVGAGQITEIIKRVGGFDSAEGSSDIARKNKAELIDAIAKGTKAIEKLPYPEGIKELKALEVLIRVEEQLPEEAKKGIETAKENIEKKLVETGEIQKAKDWKIEQGASGKILVEGVPVEVNTFEKVVEKIEEKTKEVNPVTQRPNIVNIEAVKELKIKLQAASRRPYDHIGNFKVEIDGVIQAEFKEVSGIESETGVVEYQDGDDLILKRPGRTKYSNIVLKKGSLTSQKLHDWYERIAKGAKERKSISIIVLDRAGQEVGRYNLFDAFPVKFEGGDYSVEEIELRAEGGIIIGKKITPDKVKSGPEQIRLPVACPLIVPDTSKGKEACLKAAKQLNEKYPGCNYAKICEDISEQKPSLDCGPAPAAPGNWKCIDGAWEDVSQCGKIQCLRYDPVCGTDGKTYSCGEIDAKSCGVGVAYRGECKKQEYPTPPLPDEQPAKSSESVSETKLPQPIFCTQEWNPVCGTDNKTYSNECMAKAVGVAVQYNGECYPASMTR